eukprot:GHVU01015160.1.p1 GENE.GHVU01015160.1~~GHVU01015160.1.p1  ORF type:complete len:103 (-),score=9.20 GHVU01015160.1:36-344(-)
MYAWVRACVCVCAYVSVRVYRLLPCVCVCVGWPIAVRRTWAMDYSNYGVCKKVAFEASKTCLVATKDKEPLITDCVNKILKKIDDYSHNECFTMGECVGPLL